MELIDKAKLLAEIKRRILEDYNTGDKEKDAVAQGAIASLKYYIEDTLEVKEVEESSNDLKEAARKVGQKYFPDENNIWARPNYEAIAAANAFKDGAKWQEEQIMKYAIEREVKVDAGGYPYIDATELYDYDNDKSLAKARDKVKVVFIKDK